MLKIWLLFTLILVIPVLFLDKASTSIPRPTTPQLAIETKAKTLLEISAFNEAKIKSADPKLDDKPNPIGTIYLEGQLPSNPNTKRTHESMRDLPKIYDISYAYSVTKDTKYSKKATEFLLAWAKTNKSRGNPIDDTHLESIFDSYDLIKETLTEQEDQIIKAWFSQIAEAHINTELYGAQNYNNWVSHRIKIVGLTGYATQNQNYINYANQVFRMHLEQNLNADGTSYDYLERSSLFYHAYTLEPLLVFAKVSALNGQNIFSYQTSKGASIENSIQFMIPFILGDKDHPEFLDSKAAFDKIREQNGIVEYKAGRLFKPEEGLKTLELYSFFNPDVLPIIRNLVKSENIYPTFNTYIYQTQRDKVISSF